MENSFGQNKRAKRKKKVFQIYLKDFFLSFCPFVLSKRIFHFIPP